MDALVSLEFELSCTRGDGEQSFCIEAPLIQLCSGEILALTGPSGSGKSTLLEILGLVLEPDSGSRFIWQFDPNLACLNIADLWKNRKENELCGLRSHKLGFILQSGGLVPFLTVRENIALPRILVGMAEWDEAVDSLITVLGIGHLLTKKPQQLSVGERQRTSIARALAHQPPLLLADEPTAALDPARAEIVMKLLVDLVRERNGMAVIVTHDRDLIRRMGLKEMCAHLHTNGKTARFACEA